MHWEGSWGWKRRRRQARATAHAHRKPRVHASVWEKLAFKPVPSLGCSSPWPRKKRPGFSTAIAFKTSNPAFNKAYKLSIRCLWSQKVLR